MPAASSSPIPVVARQLAELATHETPGSLVTALTAVRDPRKARGVRHSCGVILTVAACAVLAGCRSWTAIGQWAQTISAGVRAELGITSVVPCESTIRRVLQCLDDDDLDTAIGEWMACRTAPQRATRRTIAVDGKRARGSGGTTVAPRHLLAAIDHRHGVVLAQRDIAATGSEIDEFTPLLNTLDLTGAVVTADALHTQRGHAAALHRRAAHYVFTVKANQPSLHRQLTTLPWSQAPVLGNVGESGHGRVERRTIKVVTVEQGLLFPHARQAIRITRTTRRNGSPRWTRQTAYAVTSLPTEQASPAELTDLVRRHWHIENRLHWIRDVIFDEDRSQIRTHAGPRVMASLRNLAISLHRLTSGTGIATALRHHSWNPHHAAQLLMTS